MTLASSPDPPPRLKRVLIYVASILAMAGCLVVFPCVGAVHNDLTEHSFARMTLQQIGGALYLFDEKHGHLPPAVVHGKDCQPLYNWRVLVLPFLVQEKLYQKF
jgi:hypothetical protein